MQEQPTYRDLAGLAALVKIGVIGCLLAAVFSGWSSWLQLDLLQRVAAGAEVTETEADSNDRREMFSGLLFLAVYIATAIVFLRWIYLAKRNAQALGATGLQFTPGWSVGYFFVPVMNLWKPYQSMRETFKASSPEHGEDWADATTPAVVGVWWTFWIISLIVSQLAFRVGLRAETLNSRLAATWLDLLSSLSEALLCASALVLISALTAMQEEKHWKLMPTTREPKMEDSRFAN